MSDPYLDIANAADSYSLQRRVTACAAQEGVEEDPFTWTVDNRYLWASAPGWGAAFASAAASGDPDPGANPAVVSDSMILAQVQLMLG